jgi:hypothetical protein
MMAGFLPLYAARRHPVAADAVVCSNGVYLPKNTGVGGYFKFQTHAAPFRTSSSGMAFGCDDPSPPVTLMQGAQKERALFGFQGTATSVAIKLGNRA